MAIPTPGINGLARANAQTVTSPEWATVCQNAVLDAEGRLAARKGWVKQNSAAIASSPNIQQMFEYIKGDQTVEVLSSANLKIYSGVSTLTDITGSITTPTASNWQFVNFNGKVLGFQQSHTPCKWTGTGNFANATAASGSLPTGNCAVAAFGRVWACDADRQTIKYCALLDDTLWDTADGGGSIDMRKVWTRGMDEVVGITSYGSSLIVFGRRHIVFWVDGSGSEIGVDPTNIYVNSVIENCGLVSRDAVALLGELDVIFWSYNGVRSLRRTIQELATPVNEVTSRNREYIASYISTGDITKVRMVYSPEEGFVLLIHPGADKTWCFDLRYPLPDGSLRMFEWDLVPTAAVHRQSGILLFGFAGYIGKYDEYDDNDVAYRFIYHSGWFPLNPDLAVKMAKRTKVGIASRVAVVVSFKWWFDFRSSLHALQRTFTPPGGSLYNYQPDQYNYTAQYSGGGGIIDKYLPLRDAGQYFRFGIEVSIDGYPFAIQFVNIMYEPTRFA
jgi:hypothetical protein